MNKSFETTVFVFTFIFFVAALIFGVFGGLLVKEDGAIQLLEAQGFSDVNITSHQWLFVGLRGCEDSDAAKFTFEATGPNGQIVDNLFVCKGLFKGYTLRGK